MRLAVLSLITLSLGVVAVGCRPASGGSNGVPAWPDSLPTADAFGAARGWVPIRTLLHVHSVFSHDACDGAPQDADERIDETCRQRFRDALCLANVDAAFLTEHDRYLVRADSIAEAISLGPGDARVERDGRLVAARASCGTLVFAGAENTLMPVGFDSLPRGTREARRAFYEAATPGASEMYRRYGAFVLLSHPEDLPVSRIADLGPDAVEVYNPHANFAPKHRASQGFSRLGAIFELVPFLFRQTPIHPDLALATIFRRNANALDKWDVLLGQRMIFGFGASDAHENTIPWRFADGERGDAYARMIPWVTNVVFVPAAERDDPVALATAIEEALHAGHFYVAIEAWGTPAGFDFHSAGAHGTSEMGSTVALAPGLRLRVAPPTVFGLTDAQPAPPITVRLVRISPGGTREIVDESTSAIDHTVEEPGVYRAVATIEPRHLSPYMGFHAGLVMRELDWVYSNPIRVVATRDPVAREGALE